MPSPSRSSPLSTLLTYTGNSPRSVPGQQVDTSGTPAVPTSRHAFAVAHLVRGSSANEIIQNVLQLDHAGAERHLSQFAFESDPTSGRTAMDYAQHWALHGIDPAWTSASCRPSEQAEPWLPTTAPQAPMSPFGSLPDFDPEDVLARLDRQVSEPISRASLVSTGSIQSSSLETSAPSSPQDEEEPVLRANPYLNSMSLPVGATINSRGLLERTDISQVFRAVEIGRVEEQDPLDWGFSASTRFDGVSKMLDGDVVIAAMTPEGAKRYADPEFASTGYRLYRIATHGLRAVSLLENMQFNARFLEQRENTEEGLIAKLNAQNRGAEFGEGAAGFAEVHIEDAIDTSRITLIHR